MLKKNLRNRLKKRARTLTASLLAFSMLTSLCPLYAAAVENTPFSEGESIPDGAIWSGQIAEGFAVGSGGRYDPYLISSPEELAYLAKSVNSGVDYSGLYFRLTANLYLNDPSSFNNRSNKPPQNEWTPIGGYISLSITDKDAYDRAVAQYQTLYLRSEEGYEPADGYIKNAIYYHLAEFNGHFDGDGYSIFGLYLSTDAHCAGLFGACKDAELIDLTLDSVNISAVDEVGALVGHFDAEKSASIQNCHINADITAGGSMAGGLVGSYTAHTENALLSIVDCTYSGNLQAIDSVGGILGSAVSTDRAGKLLIDSSTANTYITAEHTAGGIVGSLTLPSTLLSLSSEGAISADRNIGGIVGSVTSYTDYITVSDCKNNSSLVGQKAVGGIIGHCTADRKDSSASDADPVASDTVIELLGASNLGNLYGSESAGGIIGIASTVGSSKINLVNCKNSAAVSGKQKVGGIAGSLLSDDGLITVGSAENHGAVTADTLVGGIIGEASTTAELTIYRCVSYGAITADGEYAGGIAGKIGAAEDGHLLLELSCSSGNVKAAKYSGGIVGIQTADHSSARTEITNCFSYAQLTADENAGGIAGAIYVPSGHAIIGKCLFVGSFTSGNKVTGGISAYIHAEKADATAEINECYYLQSVASRPALLYGGSGSELCQTASGLSDASFKNTEQFIGLDFESIWQASDEENIYPSLRAIPFVWQSYLYTISGKSASLTAYLGSSDVVVIPAKLGGMSVTTIDNSAFRGSSVVKVILPDSVTTIGEYAFADCQYLRSITLSSDLRAVGAGAFNNCTALETRRSASSLSDLYIGSDNQAFSALPLIQPVTLQVEYRYEDGSSASKSSSITCYKGDHYLIDAPAITGYEADASTLAGICNGEGKIGVIYRLGSYRLTIRYLYPDGSEAAESYSAIYRFGDAYSIVSPNVAGYLPANSILEGLMEGEDMVLTVYYSEQLVSAADDTSANQSTLIILLIFASFALICCIGYFIFRYRSNHRKEEDDTDFDPFFTPRF